MGLKTFFAGERKNILAISNASGAISKTLRASESGTLLTIDPSSSTSSRNILITLPTVSEGLIYSFVILNNSGNTANDIKFTSAHADNDIDGLLMGKEASDTNLGVTAAATCALTIDSGNGNTYQYSRWTVTCDGTNWLLQDAIFQILVSAAGTASSKNLIFGNAVLT
jgi:acetaldehyde dehydrogenase (acetylating)